jgi:DNA-binding CsgD family transcriptional regulator
LNINILEKEIIKYNREGKQKLSQKKLSDLLFSGDLSKEEEANVLYYMAATYRGVSDYMMCIDYLNKSYAIAKDLPKDNILRMKLDYEYAFSYFDNKEYDKSSKMMDRIAAKNYISAIPEDQSYILMQEGYLFLRDKKYDRAELKYEQALEIMKTANNCNLPIVLVKMMDLYHQKNDIKKVESLYAESMKISKGCGILRYETYAASEMESIYKERNLLSKAYAVSLKVDSLKKIEDLESKVSEMHVIDKKYIEKKEALQEKSVFWEKIGAVFVATILLSIITYSFRKSKSLKTEKQKMEEEMEQIRDDLNSYSESYYSTEKSVSLESAIINSDKLTDRQKELLKLMADGLSNKEIGEKLFITESTVKYHIKNIYSILELKDRKDFFKKINNN